MTAPAAAPRPDRPPAPDGRSEPGRAPMPPPTLRVLAAELWHGFSRTGVSGLATQIAYSLFFAIVPTLVLVLSLGGFVDAALGVPVADVLRDLVNGSAPEALKPPLLEIVERTIERTSAGRASAGAAAAVVLAVWSASGAVGSLVNASNRAYGVRKTRPFLVDRVTNACLAAVIAGLTVAAATLLVFGASLGRRLADGLGGGDADAALAVLRWALVVGCPLLALLLLYRVGPDLDLGVRWLLPGAGLATAAWLALVVGFSRLLGWVNVGDPYGAFGSLVVLLWFLYLTGFVAVLGAVVNAVVGARWDRRRRADLARHPEKRLFCADGREVDPAAVARPPGSGGTPGRSRWRRRG